MVDIGIREGVMSEILDERLQFTVLNIIDYGSEPAEDHCEAEHRSFIGDEWEGVQWPTKTGLRTLDVHGKRMTWPVQINPFHYWYSLTNRYGELKPIGQGLDVNAILSSPAPIGVEI